MFAWMRPNDLVWNYVVNNYLLGNEPPAHDILFWNSDTTRLPARLHADFLDLFEANPFPRPRQAARARPQGRPREDRHRHLRRRRPHRPHHAVAGRLPDRAALRRRAQHVRARRTAATSRASSTRRATSARGSWRRRRARRRAEALARSGSRRAKAAGGRTGASGSRRASGPTKPAPTSLGSERHPAARRGARHLRARAMTAAMRLPPSAPRAHAHRARPHRRASHPLRVRDRAIAARPPLLFLNGLGANIELAQPFIDALPGPTVVIFDVPGVGGSPTPPSPYRPAGIARLAAGLLDHLGYCRGGRARRVVGRSDRAAVRAPASARAAAGSCSRRRRRARSWCPAHPSVLLKMATPRRYVDRAHAHRVAGDVYGGAFRRDPGARRGDAAPRPLLEPRRLLPAARRRVRLDEPAVAVDAAPADADHGRRRRSAGPDRQRALDAMADSRRAARDRRLRPPVPRHAPGRVGAHRRSFLTDPLAARASARLAAKPEPSSRRTA